MQRLARNIKFDRSLANIFAVGIHIDGNIRLNADPVSLPIFDIFRKEMPPEIGSWKPAKQFELVHRAHHTQIQLPIIEFRLRSYLDTAAISGGVGNGREQCGSRG